MVIAHNGTTFNKKGKIRSCPACPVSLLPNTVTQSRPAAEDGGVPEAERVQFRACVDKK